jgi:hypothetical protein
LRRTAFTAAQKPCRVNNEFATNPQWRQLGGKFSELISQRDSGDWGRITAMETRCSKCGAPMSCTPEGDCWCMELPHGPMPLPGAGEAEGCLCRTCLERKLHELGIGKNPPQSLKP